MTSTFNNFFNNAGTIRANLPRDDTCTVMAEFDNDHEYADNGIERFVEREKRRLRRDYEEHPAWRGAYGRGALDAPPLLLGSPSARQAREDPSKSLTDVVRQRRVDESAAKYLRAEETRQRFERQRDREAHERDLEFIDRRGVEYLPDGTRIRHPVPERHKSSFFAASGQQPPMRLKSFTRRPVSHSRLTRADELLLRDYLAPPVVDRYVEGVAGGASSANKFIIEAHKGNPSMPTAEDIDRGKFICNTADQDGCPIDAGIGEGGLFQQIKRWRRFVPAHSNFSGAQIDWDLRLDRPLHERERSFEMLVATMTADDERVTAMQAEETRLQLLSQRSTPVYFEGDGDGAELTRLAQPPLPKIADDDDYGRHSPFVSRLRGDFDDSGLDEESQRRRRRIYGLLEQQKYARQREKEEESPPRRYESPPAQLPTDVASPLSQLPGFFITDPQQAGDFRPGTARTATTTAGGGAAAGGRGKFVPTRPTTAASTARAGGGRRPTSARFILPSSQQHSPHSPHSASRRQDQQQQPQQRSPRAPLSQATVAARARRNIFHDDRDIEVHGDVDAAAQRGPLALHEKTIGSARRAVVEKKFKTLPFDPRFTRPERTVLSVGQRMHTSARMP